MYHECTPSLQCILVSAFGLLWPRPLSTSALLSRYLLQILTIVQKSHILQTGLAILAYY